MNKVYKTVLVAAAAAIVAGATVVPQASVSAWGDSANGRQAYTLEQINAGQLGNKITFNSITNGKIGDERNFVGAKLSTDTNNVWNADKVTVQDGQTYTIRLYVHNNSPLGTNAIAQGVKTTFAVPTTVGKSHTIVGYIDSTNASPNRYWDEVVLESSEDFYIEYVDGSARYTNAKIGTVPLANEVVTSGATIGYDALNGNIPGCYDYDGQVTINVKVHTARVDTKLDLTLRKKGTNDEFVERMDLNVGDLVEYQIYYNNLGNTRAENVMIRDVLPQNVEYVADSTYLYNSNHQQGVHVLDNTLTTNGINIGNYSPQGKAFVRFTGKVVDNSLTKGATNQLVSWASATVRGKVFKDDASVVVLTAAPANSTPNPNPNPDPTPNPTPVVVDNPGTIVSTGPTEVAFGALGVGSVVTALGYYIASRKKLM